MSARFFSENSFWNTPIADGAEIDPKSEEMLKLLEKVSEEVKFPQKSDDNLLSLKF